MCGTRQRRAPAPQMASSARSRGGGSVVLVAAAWRGSRRVARGEHASSGRAHLAAAGAARSDAPTSLAARAGRIKPRAPAFHPTRVATTTSGAKTAQRNFQLIVLLLYYTRCALRGSSYAGQGSRRGNARCGRVGGWVVLFHRGRRLVKRHELTEVGLAAQQGGGAVALIADEHTIARPRLDGPSPRAVHGSIRRRVWVVGATVAVRVTGAGWSAGAHVDPNTV